MKRFESVAPEQFRYNPFTMINNDWMLIAAQNGEKPNAMTASWGGVGILWGKPVAYIFVRKSRFTKELIDSSASFSLNVFNPEQYRKMLGYMGRVSGRDEDKIATAGLTLRTASDTPFFDEARTVFLCKKLSRHFLDPEGFIDREIDAKWYSDHDYHDLYVGEITEILEAQE